MFDALAPRLEIWRNQLYVAPPKRMEVQWDAPLVEASSIGVRMWDSDTDPGHWGDLEKPVPEVPIKVSAVDAVTGQSIADGQVSISDDSADLGLNPPPHEHQLDQEFNWTFVTRGGHVIGKPVVAPTIFVRAREYNDEEVSDWYKSMPLVDKATKFPPIKPHPN